MTDKLRAAVQIFLEYWDNPFKKVDEDDVNALRAALAEPAQPQQPLSDEPALRFAGWFREIPSAMSYRLWEQVGHAQEQYNVALYEAAHGITQPRMSAAYKAGISPMAAWPWETGEKP